MTELKYRVPQQDVLVMKEVHRVLTLLESSLGGKAKTSERALSIFIIPIFSITIEWG